jgi:hypothetical protein
MASIYTYPEIGGLSNEDLFIVTDVSNGNSTKSVDLQTLADYIGSSESGGSVTSVTGTGSVSGITLSGNVTSSGSLTLGGSLILTSSQITNGLGYTPSSFDGDYNSLTNQPTIPDGVFKNFAVNGQTTVVADSISDTLTLVAGDNITIATDSALDTITISALSTLNNNFADDIIVNGVIVGAGSNVNADENTRIGALSLGQSSGNFNTAVGWSALRYNATGQYNTAIGNASMSQYLISGSSNVGVGYRSLRALSSGMSNVAVGNLTLAAISGGNNNVAIGTGALDLLVNSSNNIGIGTDSLGGLVTGGGNVAMGYRAGGLTRNNLNDSVFIGLESSSNSDNQTNQIVIGATATGNGSNTATIGNSDVTELHVGGNGAGLVLKSPNGTAYKITVSDGGAIVATAI